MADAIREAIRARALALGFDAVGFADAHLGDAARVPVFAIGGINAARVAEVIAAGCAGVAVMGGVMRAVDPAREVGALITTLKGSLAVSARDKC